MNNNKKVRHRNYNSRVNYSANVWDRPKLHLSLIARARILRNDIVVLSLPVILSSMIIMHNNMFYLSLTWHEHDNIVLQQNRSFSVKVLNRGRKRD